MNSYNTLAERREVTKQLMERELYLLEDCQYNPIKKQHIEPAKETTYEYETDPDTPWLEALDTVYKRLKVECFDDMKGPVKYVGIAANQLRFDNLAIKVVRRKHIKIILNHLQKTLPQPPKDGKPGKPATTWGQASYNRYRSHLMSMFKELLELEAVDSDLVSSIKK